MCSKVVFYSPRNDADYVTEATRLLRQRLGLEDAECTDVITKLEKDHENIAKMCQKALDNEKMRKENEAKSYENSWKAYSIRLLTNVAVSNLITVPIGLFVAYITSKHNKPYVLVAIAGGLLWGYLRTPSTLESKELKSSELSVKARMEKNWMRTWLEQVNIMYKESVEKIAKGDVSEATRDLRDQQLLVKSFLEEVGR